MSQLIQPAQLDSFCKKQKYVVILDATWYPPVENRDVKKEFLQCHIRGARFLDLNLFHDETSELPCMLLRDESLISERISTLGIHHDCKLVFYDNSPLHTSCRALWMFKVFGHPPHQLYLLDGSIQRWEKEGGRVERGERPHLATSYTVCFAAQYIRTLIQMKSNLHHPVEQVIDLRHAIRYVGGMESREGLRTGHIPGSFSFPFMTMFESDGRWKPIDRIRKQLMGLGVELARPIVTTCGSGMTAPILNTALDRMDQTQHALYDGSWSEWGAEKCYHGEESLMERPVETSLEE
jgi:thiosulfate/3-mercaptopyruvate sulfurtransferase